MSLLDTISFATIPFHRITDKPESVYKRLFSSLTERRHWLCSFRHLSMSCWRAESAAPEFVSSKKYQGCRLWKTRIIFSKSSHRTSLQAFQLEQNAQLYQTGYCPGRSPSNQPSQAPHCPANGTGQWHL